MYPNLDDIFKTCDEIDLKEPKYNIFEIKPKTEMCKSIGYTDLVRIPDVKYIKDDDSKNDSKNELVFVLLLKNLAALVINHRITDYLQGEAEILIFILSSIFYENLWKLVNEKFKSTKFKSKSESSRIFFDSDNKLLWVWEPNEKDTYEMEFSRFATENVKRIFEIVHGFDKKIKPYIEATMEKYKSLGDSESSFIDFLYFKTFVKMYIDILKKYKKKYKTKIFDEEISEISKSDAKRDVFLEIFSAMLLPYELTMGVRFTKNKETKEKLFRIFLNMDRDIEFPLFLLIKDSILSKGIYENIGSTGTYYDINSYNRGDANYKAGKEVLDDLNIFEDGDRRLKYYQDLFQEELEDIKKMRQDNGVFKNTLIIAGSIGVVAAVGLVYIFGSKKTSGK